MDISEARQLFDGSANKRVWSRGELRAFIKALTLLELQFPAEAPQLHEADPAEPALDNS